MNIHFLSLKKDVPAMGYWDQTFLTNLLEDLPDGDRSVIVIPGAYQADIIPEINEYIMQHKKVMVFLTSDEERKFDCSQLKHPDMILYCQYGGCEHIFPIGYTGETRRRLKDIGLVEKDIDVFFAGQLNSQERRSIFARFIYHDKAVLFGTEGFSRGLKPDEYYDYMSHTKFALAPGGHVSPDSFRFYEALEAGAIPLSYPAYMKRLFPDMPDILDATQVFSWWIRKKVELRNKLREQLGCAPFATTAVITTSPISSHPSTHMIEQTIKSIRHYLDCDIIIAIDGVRSEQEHLRRQYDKYIQELLWKCNFEYQNVKPVVFDTHHHQSGMMREILPMITTPLLLFAEHDTPLVTDEPIDFDYLQQKILSSEAYAIRFHYEALIPEPHKHMMIGEPEGDLQATFQWSQRPHLAQVYLYQGLMKFFSENSNCFIEDLVHGKLITAYEQGGWEGWKVYIYHPEGGNIKRSLNLDGRGTDKKYDEEQVW